MLKLVYCIDTDFNMKKVRNDDLCSLRAYAYMCMYYVCLNQWTTALEGAKHLCFVYVESGKLHCPSHPDVCIPNNHVCDRENDCPGEVDQPSEEETFQFCKSYTDFTSCEYHPQSSVAHTL